MWKVEYHHLAWREGSPSAHFWSDSNSCKFAEQLIKKTKTKKIKIKTRNHICLISGFCYGVGSEAPSMVGGDEVDGGGGGKLTLLF